jgi:O-acetylserine/cysteine efflux transporter
VKPAHLLLALLVAAIWGFGFVPSKVATSEVPPFFVVSLRFALVAACTVWLIRVPRGQWRGLIAFSLLMGVGHFAPAYMGLRLGVDSTTAALIWQLQVPLTVAIAFLVLHERLGWRGLVGLAIALAGVAIFLGEPQHQANWLPIGLQFLGVVFNAFANIQAKRLSHLNPFVINAAMAVIAAPVLGLLSAIFETGQFASLAAASWRTPAGIAYLAIVSTLVGFGAFYYLLRRYPVGWVSTIVLLVPLTGALSGVLVMGDRLSWYSALGGAAMLAGVGLIIVSPRAFRGRAATAGLGEEPRA